MLKKLYRLAKSKKEWRKPAQAKCLIFDSRTGQPLKCLIDPRNISELFHPAEKINMLIALQCLLQGKISILCYFSNYIQSVNPKVVLTMSDNNIHFYELKKFSPTTTFIAIQSSWRGKRFFGDNSPDTPCCDYYLALNKASGQMMGRIVKCKVIVSGSLLNNALMINAVKKQREKKKLVFISEFRREKEELPSVCIKHNGTLATWEELYSLEKKLLPALHKFCQKNKIEFIILGAKPVDYAQEHNFFKKYLPKLGWNYNPRTSWFSSYEAISSSDFVVYINSTLGYEAFSFGKPVACISARGHWLADFDDRKFGWPNKFPSQGLCWTNDFNKKAVEKVLKNLISKPNRYQRKYLQAVRIKVMQYDRGNQKLKILLNQVGIKIKPDFTKDVQYKCAR